MPRLEFGKRIRAQIVLRATNGNGVICCELCALVLGKRPYQVDHILPEALCDHTMQRDLKREDGQLLCIPCHKEKTDRDVKQIRKADRQYKRDAGITRPSGQIQSRGFAKGNTKPALWRT